MLKCKCKKANAKNANVKKQMQKSGFIKQM